MSWIDRKNLTNLVENSKIPPRCVLIYILALFWLCFLYLAQFFDTTNGNWRMVGIFLLLRRTIWCLWKVQNQSLSDNVSHFRLTLWRFLSKRGRNRARRGIRFSRPLRLKSGRCSLPTSQLVIYNAKWSKLFCQVFLGQLKPSPSKRSQSLPAMVSPFWCSVISSLNIV